MILPVNVRGRFAQFDTGDGCALRQLLAATMTCQGLPQTIQEGFLQGDNIFRLMFFWNVLDFIHSSHDVPDFNLWPTFHSGLHNKAWPVRTDVIYIHHPEKQCNKNSLFKG